MTTSNQERIDAEIQGAFRSAVEEAETSINTTARLAEFTEAPRRGWLARTLFSGAISQKALTLGGAAACAVVTVAGLAYVVRSDVSPTLPSEQEVAANRSNLEGFEDESGNQRGSSENGEGNLGQTDFSDGDRSADSPDPRNPSDTSDDTSKLGEDPDVDSDQNDGGLNSADEIDAEETALSPGTSSIPASGGPAGVPSTNTGGASNVDDTAGTASGSARSSSGITSTTSKTQSTLARTQTSSPISGNPATTATQTRRTTLRPTTLIDQAGRPPLEPPNFRIIPTTSTTATGSLNDDSTTLPQQSTTTQPTITTSALITTTTTTSTTLTTTSTQPTSTTCSFTVDGGGLNEAVASIRAAGCTGPISYDPPNAVGSLAFVAGGNTQTIEQDEAVTLVGYSRVPDVEGLSQSDAAAAIRAESFIPIAETQPTPAADQSIGTVVSQSPRPSTRQQARSIVRYTVAVAQSPETSE